MKNNLKANEDKSWLFGKKTDKIDKLPAILIKKKRETTQNINIRI